MITIKSLRIRIGTTDVASLFSADDGRVHLIFDDDYIENPNRPTLSCFFNDKDDSITKAQLRDPYSQFSNGNGNGKLPPFFQNLLPEGQLRKHLMEVANLDPSNEFDLLAFCGKSLPGNIYALQESLDNPALGRLLSLESDKLEMSAHQMPTPEGVSLSGFQPKIGLVDEGGRYVMRSKNGAGKHFIGKLPTSDMAFMPEVEFSSLKLAAAAGATVCEAQLLPLSAIASKLPFTMSDDARNFLLVDRFDRDAPTPTHRLHVEDFAQIMGIDPSLKYGANYAAVGQAILEHSAMGSEDVFELLRRLKINELLGNFDAHLKNFSLLYTDSRKAKLSPAYDIVSHATYFNGQGHALKFTSDQDTRQLLTPEIIRKLSNIWGLPEVKMTSVVTETVHLAMTTWPTLINELPFSENQREKLRSFLHANPSVEAWNRRLAKKRLRQ